MSDDIEAILKAEQDRKRACDEAERQRQERFPKVRLINDALNNFRVTTRENWHLLNRCVASEEDLSRIREVLADAFISLARRLKTEGEEYRLDGLSSSGPKSALAENLYQLGRRGERDALLDRLKQLQTTPPEFQSEVWQIVGELTEEILDTSEAMFGVPLFGKHANRALTGAGEERGGTHPMIPNRRDEPAPNLDPAIQAILDEAREKQREAVALQRAHDEAEARGRRAYEAWLQVYHFRGDAIPGGMTSDERQRRYAELIVELGQVLKRDGWQDRLDAVTAGSGAKSYAVAMLRRAMEGDISTVTMMVRESISTSLQPGLEADGWLREKLMYEVLNIQPAPEPPLGWEGFFPGPIETIDDFTKWMDSQITIHEILHRGQGNGSSDGRLVRNAYRLVMHLGLTGMPLEPTGNLTFNDELAILRNLRRLSLERRDRAVDEEEDGAGGAGDQAGAEQAEGIDGVGLPDSKDSRMSTNPFRDYAAFAWQICEEERKRDLSPDRRRRPLGEMQRHIREREIALQQHRNAALAAGRKTGHNQSEVEQRVVALCEQCRKLLLWEKDAPRLTAEQLRERQQSACCTGDPAGVYLVNLINAFWPLWEKVNDLAAAYDGSAERPLRERTAGQSGAKQPEGAGAVRDPAGGEQAEAMPDSDP